MSLRYKLAMVAAAAVLASNPALAVNNNVMSNTAIAALPVSQGFSNSFASLGGGTYQDLAGHVISNATALTTPGGATYNFYDDYLFTLPGASNGSLTATAVSVTFGDLFGINNLQARLYAATPATLTTGTAAGLVSGWSVPTSVGGSTVTVSTFAAPVSLLAGTSYALEIRGNVVGATGSYGGALNISAAPILTPVPEADTWAMTLAGLGALGWIVRRRRPAV